MGNFKKHERLLIILIINLLYQRKLTVRIRIIMPDYTLAYKYPCIITTINYAIWDIYKLNVKTVKLRVKYISDII